MSRFSSKFSNILDEGAILSSDEDYVVSQKTKENNNKRSTLQTSSIAQKKKKKSKKKILDSENSKKQSHVAGVTKKKEWEEWLEKDSKLVDKKFETDLSEALMQSQLDCLPSSVAQSQCNDFAKVEEDAIKKASNIVLVEMQTAERTALQRVELEIHSKYQHQLNSKDNLIVSKEQQIVDLRDALAHQTAETEKVQKLLDIGKGHSTQQLCQEISDLTQIINEFTSQIQDLDSQLEKEKTKSAQLQAEVLRLRSHSQQ